MRKGFTLIELLTVIAIIGILASLTVYIWASALMRQRDSQRITDLRSIGNALELFYADHRGYPDYKARGTGQNESRLYQAKWQLEASYHYPGQLCKADSQNIKFIAPVYIGSVPEDPAYKFTLDQTNCQPAGGLFGQYLYLGFPKEPGSLSQNGFILLARVERLANVNWSDSLLLKIRQAGYIFDTPCDADRFRNNPAGCPHNYYLENSRNQ